MIGWILVGTFLVWLAVAVVVSLAVAAGIRIADREAAEPDGD